MDNTLKTDSFEVVGLAEQMKQLDAIMMANPDMEKRVQRLIRDVLMEVRSELSRQAQSGLQMKSDPRQAYKAIRTTVYRQILGGNINLLNPKKAGTPHASLPPAPRTGRGGNRRKREKRTVNLQSYWGPDRAFVLRFLNQGAGPRSIKNFKKNGNRKVDRWNSSPNTGNRGTIASRDWFGNASLQALRDGADNLTTLIETLIAERFNKG